MSFAASSGRRYDTLCEFFAPVVDDMDFVASNGCQVYVDGVMVDREVYSHAAIKRLERTVLKFDCLHLVLFDRTSSFLYDDTDVYEREIDKDLPAPRRIYETPGPQVNIIKASVYCDDATKTWDMAYALGRELADTFVMAPSGTKWIDVMQIGVNKWTGIQQVMDAHGITPDEVMSFSGSQDGIGHLGLALCNDGDLVLLPDPCYPVFMTGSKLGGAEPWYYKLTKENHFLPDVTSIPEDVARRAKLMLVSLPANPVGSIGTPELYAEIVDFCRKYDILLVHDNAYSDIIFDGAHGGSIFNTPGAGECAVEFFSLSKSFNVTGARISFLVGRRDVIAACKKLRTQIDFGMFLPIQKVAIAALTGPLDGVRRQCGEYQRRRDALCGGLRGIG